MIAGRYSYSYRSVCSVTSSHTDLSTGTVWASQPRDWAFLVMSLSGFRHLPRLSPVALSPVDRLHRQFPFRRAPAYFEDYASMFCLISTLDCIRQATPSIPFALFTMQACTFESRYPSVMRYTHCSLLLLR
jgi:hypothetical protein